MKLYLLRHSEAEPIIRKNETDFDRKLTAEGISKAFDFLKTYYLENKKLEIYCSPSSRTLETAKIIFQNKNINYEDKLYNPSLEELLHFIWNINSKKDLVIVSHNNGISKLANYFTSNLGLYLDTCEMIVLDFNINTWVEATKESASLISNDYFLMNTKSL